MVATRRLTPDIWLASKSQPFILTPVVEGWEKSILYAFRVQSNYNHIKLKARLHDATKTCDMQRASKSHYVNGLIATCDCRKKVG